MTKWNNISKKDAKRLGIEGTLELVKLEQKEERKNKYNNSKPTIDGITFDSQKEADYYCDLKLLKKAGKIKDFELQPKFWLLSPEEDRVTGRGIYYRADFRVKYPDGREEIIDVKGSKKTLTAVYKIKKKLLLAKYPEINFREVYDVGY